MSRDHIHLLLVEDNPGDARLIREMLNDEWGQGAYQIRFADSMNGAIEALGCEEPNILLLDLSLPDSFGLDTFRRIQTVAPRAPIIVLTGNQDQDLALSAVKEGAQDFLVKNDLTGHLLVKAIQYARERKQIEASLRVNEARFRSLAELSSDWYWEQDPQGRINYISEGLKLKSGVDPARLMGLHWWEVPRLDCEGGSGSWDELRQKIASGLPFKDMLLKYATGGPEPVFLCVSGVPVASDSGAFAGYRGVGKDVSARERIDVALRGSEERYRRMMDSARDGILMFDADGKVTFANRRICTMLGFGENEICGRALRELAAADNPPRHEVARAAQSPDALELRRKDGGSVWTMQATCPVQARDGSHAGTLSIFTDITEFKEREERIRHLAGLAAEKSEAERANLAKSRFLAAVSHDLRQPMHALGMFIEDLRAASPRPRESGLIDKIDAALRLTNDLLDTILVMSRLESGMVVPSVGVFPVQALFTRALQTFAPLAETRNLRFSVVPCHALVRSDPSLLQRIVFNLVSNAIRYTDHGGIVLGCRTRGEMVHIEVWDTGLGIPEEFQTAIFREFFRIEEQGTKRGGLGLGLAIVQSCSSLLGHTLDLRSRVGKGSRFTVRVPAGRVLEKQEDEAEGEFADADEAVVPGEPVPFAGLRVLVVDDDALLLEGTCGLLRRWGCEVVAAHSWSNAQEQLNTPVQGAACQVDFVLSDLHLVGGGSGIDLVRRLRDAGDPALPAVILTGDTSFQTAREIRKHGLKFLYKPVPAGRLKALMGQLLQAATA